MSCLPVAKRIRRILRKMLPFSSRKPSGYNMLKTDDSDRNQHNFCSDFFESASSSFKTPEKDISNKTFTVQNKGVNGFGSASSGYSSMSPSYSPCSSPFSIYEDSEISRSFDSLLLPIQSYKKRHADIFLSSTPLPAAYSPLSSFQFAKTSSVFDSDFDFDLLGESQESQSHLKEVQRDFEMNGVTKEMDGSFIPMAASTPLVPRRYPQYNLSYYQPQMQQKPTEMQRQPMPEQTSVGYTQTVLPKKRFKPNKKSLIDHCVFCKNNGVEEKDYRNHTVKDAFGRVICPWLRRYRCPICGVDGDNSHTVKYCPKKPIITLDDLQKMTL